jgi:hypothetical protein
MQEMPAAEAQVSVHSGDAEEEDSVLPHLP